MHDGRKDVTCGGCPPAIHLALETPHGKEKRANNHTTKKKERREVTLRTEQEHGQNNGFALLLHQSHSTQTISNQTRLHNRKESRSIGLPTSNQVSCGRMPPVCNDIITRKRKATHHFLSSFDHPSSRVLVMLVLPTRTHTRSSPLPPTDTTPTRLHTHTLHTYLTYSSKAAGRA